MPSSHSQFAGFFCAFWLLHWVHTSPRTHGGHARSLFVRRVDRGLMAGLVLAISLLTCYSRHHLVYHTPAQIYVGSSVGLLTGTVYYLLTEYLPRTFAPNSTPGKLRRWVYTNPVSRALRLRDSWSVWSEGADEAVYTQWMRAIHSTSSQQPRAFQGVHPAHVRWMLAALSEADHCESVPTAFSVGCVIAVGAAQLGEPEAALSRQALLEPLPLSTGYSRELPGNTHAEECALEKLVRHCAHTPGEQGSGADAASRTPLELIMYTTMEPCSERLSGNTPCVDRIKAFNAKPPITTAAWLLSAVQKGRDAPGSVAVPNADMALRPLRIRLVVQGVQEPEDFVRCQGQRTLRDAHIEVITATPTSSPGSMGLTVPTWASVRLEVPRVEDTAWLENACLRMAKKGHAEK